MTKKSYVKFLGLLLVVGLLFAAAPVGQAQAQEGLTFNRGLPTQNLNNAAGADRSNVAWSNGNEYRTGDTFILGAAGQVWKVTKIRVWSVIGAAGDANLQLGDKFSSASLYGAIDGQTLHSLSEGTLAAESDTNSNTNITHTKVSYTGSLDYQGSSENMLQIWQHDFSNLAWIVPGGTNIFFSADGEAIATADYWFNHASNAALSGSTQDGADNVYSAWLKSNLSSMSCDSIGGTDDCDGGWDKSSDLNVQVWAVQLSAPTNVYVDDSWTTTPLWTDPDGSGPAQAMGYDAFATIQEGINAVAAGGTVNVAAGTYNENLVVNKSLNLIGAGRDETIVQAVKGRNYNGGGFQSPIVSITGDAALLNLYPINITAPVGIAGPMKGSLAAFGPLPGETGWAITGDVAYASDPLACSIPTNVSGKIALIDRGTCSFIVKADNAQKAGAIGVIIANTDDTLITMASTPGYNITIPVTMITKTNAESLKAQTPPVTAAFQANPYGPGGVTISGFTFHGNVPTTVPSNWNTGGIDGLSTQGIETDSTSPVPARQNIHITNNKFVYAGASVVLYNTVGFEVNGNIMERASINYTGFGYKPHGGNIAHVSGGLNGTIAGNTGFNPEGTISVSTSKVNVLENTIAAPAEPLSGDLDIAQYGIFVMSAAHVNIEGNTISGLNAGPKSSYTNGWPGEGIWVYSNASDVTIIDNTLSNNVIGVHVEDVPAVGGPVLRHNQFIGNVYSVLNQKGNIGTAVNTVDAKENYWISATGPNVYSVSEMGATSWAAFYNLVNGTNPPFPPFAVSDKVDFAPWCKAANCEGLAPDENGVVELSGEINIPGGIQVDVPHITYHLAADTVIQNSSPCFVVNASYTQIIAEPGAKCIPTGGSNGIDVADGLNNITIDGLEIDGSGQTSGTADGIHFSGAISDFVLADNKIHHMRGDGIEFSAEPTGVVDIAGNLFQNNTGLGINAGTFTVLANYNSWGEYSAPAIGTDISSAVDADPWTHADVALSPINTDTTSRVVTSLANVSGRPTVLKDGTLYHLWSGPTDTTLYHSVSTNPAEFPAGTLVTFNSNAPLEVASTAIIKEGTTFYMVAYDGTSNKAFALYSSADGTAWTYVNQVFDATGMTDLGKIDAPFVFNDGGTYKLYFQKKSVDGQSYKIYLATSTTVNGTYILANSGNPVLSPNTDIAAWDGKFVMHPWVVKDGTTYYMWFSAHNDTNQRIGLATSTDGITWTKSAANPVIGPVGEPTVIKDGNIWRMWHLAGGNKINYLTALDPLDLRQTLAYQVSANLVNVNAADVTITYPSSLLTIAELTSGTDIPGTFDTSVPGQINFHGYKTGAALTGPNVVLFNVTFHTNAQGSGDITLSKAEFGMPGYLSSSNVYLAAAVDTAEVKIKELPFLATDLDSSYYLTGEARNFTVTITNYGTAYTGAVLNLTLPTGVTVTVVPATIDLAAGASQTLTLTFTSTTPGEKTIGFDLKDSAGELLFSTVETATVYDKPIITIVTDPYFIIEEPGQFTVTIVNPATGRDYGNHIVFDVVIPNHVVGDFGTMSCSFGATTWPVTLVTDGTGVKARIIGLDPEGYFDVGAPFGPMTVTCTATLKTAGSYAPSWSMVDVISTTPLNERTVQTGTGSMVAYTKPTIVPTFPTSIYAGVPVTVPVVITNPDVLADPFELVLTVPAGTAVTVDGDTLTCTGTTCVIVVDPTAYPVTLNIGFTFPAAGTPDIGFALIDRAWKGTVGEDRTLAVYTKTGLPVGGNFLVTGTFSMQGNASRAGIPVTLTWGGTLVPYGPSANTTSAISNNFSLSVLYGGEYTITTLQPRYLNVTSDLLKKITVAGPYNIPALELKAGDANDDHTINGGDASIIGTQYGTGTIVSQGDVNFDNAVNIQDLALVGGNFYLTSATAYNSWLQP